MRLDRGGKTEKELTMQKTLWLLTISLVLVLIQGTAGAGIPTDAELKAKLEQKIAQMKAEGASQQEVDKYVAEFEKKVAVMKAEQKKKQAGQSEKVAALEVEMKEKVKAMKSAGASKEEINKVIADYKVKIDKEIAASSNDSTKKKEKQKSKEKTKKKATGV